MCHFRLRLLIMNVIAEVCDFIQDLVGEIETKVIICAIL